MDLIFILLTQLINSTPYTLTFQAEGGGRRLLPKLPSRKTRYAKPSQVLRRLNGPDPGGWKFRVMLDGRFTGIELDPQVIIDYVRVVFSVNGDVLCVGGVREKPSDVLFRHRYFGWMRNYYWDSRLVEPIDRSDSRLATKLRDLEGQSHHLERYASPPKESPQKNEQDKLKGPPQLRPKFDHQPLGPSRGRTSIDDSENDTKSAHPRNATTAKWQGGIGGNDTEHDDRENDTKSAQRRDATTAGIGGNDTEHDDRKNETKNAQPRNATTAKWQVGIGGNGIERLQRYEPPPSQRARPINDESSSTDVVEKDSFVHGMLLLFALIVCMWIKFLF